MRIDSFKDDYAFLSNFYPAEFVCNRGLVWKSSEHYYQAAKCIDPMEAEKIRFCKSAGESKRLGKIVKIKPNWLEIRGIVMMGALWFKFSQNDDLLRMLLETGDAELIEGNQWHDNYWGDCSCPRCKDIPGQNKLGVFLMAVREAKRI